MPDPQPPTGGNNLRPRSSKSGLASEHIAGFRDLQHLLSWKVLRRNAAYIVPLLLLWIGVSSVLGCSSGSLAFDGGHIPTGGSFASVVSGTAVAAEAYSIPIAGATVTVTNTSVTGTRETQITRTAANGSFTFNNGFLDTTGVNQFQISVSPPPGSNHTSQQFTFPVTAGQSAALIVALPQSTFNESSAASVSILQQNYQLTSSAPISIGAELLGSQGEALGESPSLVFTGNFNVINVGGLFTSTTTGTGSVSAYWYTGTVQLQSNAAAVTSTPTATSGQPTSSPNSGSGSSKSLQTGSSNRPKSTML